MKKLILPILASILLAGCAASVAPDDTFALTSERLQHRQLQTRKFDGIDPESILAASSNLLQDMGFNLAHAEVKLGILTADKKRKAGSAGQTAGAIAMAIVFGVNMVTEEAQDIRVSVVVRPTSDKVANSHMVRVSFQRWVARSDGSVMAETLVDQEIYREFFDKLSSSIFIEAQQI